MRGAALALLLCAGAARADKIDFYQGPVFASGRMVGMGGAFISVAEGADNHLVNPAAYAVRTPHTADTWFDWDLGFSQLIVPAGDDVDLDQSGRRQRIGQSAYRQVSGNLKFGRGGIGVQALSQSYDEDEEDNPRYQQTLIALGYAYSLYRGSLVIGLSALEGSARVRGAQGTREIKGGGGQLGLLWAPMGARWRLGATLRGAFLISRGEEEADPDLPEGLSVPGEFGLGLSYQFGPRPYNREATFGARKLPPAPREYLLVSGDLVVTGASEEGVGVRAFLDGARQEAGRQASLSPRLGAESELWPNRMRARAGAYFEPSRFFHVDGEGWLQAGRWHGTGGADLRLTAYWDWKLSFVFDVANRYSNVGFGLGFWH